jgi:hypothetical protein
MSSKNARNIEPDRKEGDLNPGPLGDRGSWGNLGSHPRGPEAEAQPGQDSVSGKR